MQSLESRVLKRAIWRSNRDMWNFSKVKASMVRPSTIVHMGRSTLELLWVLWVFHTYTHTYFEIALNTDVWSSVPFDISVNAIICCWYLDDGNCDWKIKIVCVCYFVFCINDFMPVKIKENWLKVAFMTALPKKCQQCYSHNFVSDCNSSFIVRKML